MQVYIYLADIDSWSICHPEALRRLPDGFIYGWAMDDGAIAVPTDAEG